MGKAGNSRVQSTLFKRILRRRVQETYGTSTPSINQLIDGLRAKYPEYCRQKPKLFARMVNQTIHSGNYKNGKLKLSSNDGSSFIADDGDDVTSRSPPTKKAKKSESSSENVDENIGAVATSDDEVYSLQSKPEFDLTKSMLRNRYTDKPKNLMEDKFVREQKLNNFDDDDDGEEEDDDVDDDGPMFKDLGGMDDVVEEMKEKVIFLMYNPWMARSYDVRLTTGILLHGPPGCGKTTLAQAIANEARVPFYKVAATELVSGISGASEENIRELFSKAYRTAPSIIFIDEIDSIASKRENHQRVMERRIVTQLMTCMDESHKKANSKKAHGKQRHVLVIGVTNSPDSLDPALRRPGRFDREINLGVPDENARIKILSALIQNSKVEATLDLVKIARSTPGFVGTDLAALVSEAGKLAMGRSTELHFVSEQTEDWWRRHWPEEMDEESITMSDFEEAAKLVQPSSKREGFSSIPNVKWEDVGGLGSLRKEFEFEIIERIKSPEDYKEPHYNSETAFLLYGPPGCGKTLIAKAVANEAGANFIHIQGPELLDKYVGESELNVRKIFSRARTCAPCIIFFDEVDALTKKRGREAGQNVEGVLNQLLTELDGGHQRKGVYVIGATNRPDVMDSALLRPGRFGKLMYVPLPNQDECGLILKALSKNRILDADVDLIAIARREACANLSGADLSELMNLAVREVIQEKTSKREAAALKGTSVSPSQSNVGGMPSTAIKAVHIEQALRKISPSVSAKEIRHYYRLSKHFSRRKSS